MKLRNFRRKFIKDFNIITGPGCKSRARQLFEISQLITRAYFTPGEYALYGFYRKDKNYSDMLRYISNSVLLDKILPALNDPAWSIILENKWLFHLYYSNFNIPKPVLYGLYNNHGGISTSGESITSQNELRQFLLEHRPPSLVIKPAGGWQGRNIYIIKKIIYNEEIQFQTAGDKLLSYSEIIKHMETYGSYRFHHGFILEKMLTQHTFLNEINPYTINHFRIVTLFNYENKPRALFSALYMGRRGRETSNINQGGIAIDIDIENGVLGKGLSKLRYGRETFTAHPDSGTEFTGVSIPFWKEIIEVAKDIASLTPELRIVGWDIIYTPDGPVVVEGNPVFGIETPQASANGYLNDNIRKEFRKFGINFPSDKLPCIHPVHFMKTLKRWI